MGNTVYISNATGKDLTRFQYGTHDLIAKNIAIGLNNRKTNSKQQPVPFPNASIRYNAFGYDSRNTTPTSISHNKATHSNPAKDHLLFRFRTVTDDDDTALINSMRNKVGEFKNYTFTFDGENSNTKYHYWNLIIEINRLVVKQQFIALCDAFAKHRLNDVIPDNHPNITLLDSDDKIFNHNITLDDIADGNIPQNQYNLMSDDDIPIDIDEKSLQVLKLSDADLDSDHPNQLTKDVIDLNLPDDIKPTNISEYMVAILKHNGQMPVPNPEMNVAAAANIISDVFSMALSTGSGSDKDNLLMYNPVTGIWSHNEDLIYSLLCTLKPYASIRQLDTVLRTFAATARNNNETFTPYHGSQYLLFKNGVLNVYDMSFHDVSEDFVKDVRFSERSYLNINYVENPDVPKIPHELLADRGQSPWNPKDFVSAYANNDPEILRYFLFGLSLGLFGGHNFGVHFDIQGESRWGKTTLLEIFNGLYDNHTQQSPYSALNGRFPFTSYRENTSVIWISECNIGTEPLNDEHGIITYDGLADNQVHFEVKGKDDIILNNPPQVYIDGTQFIKANEINTGPAGRTLAYKLPERTDALRDQAYALNIADDLKKEEVLQWLVYNMIKAFRDTVPKSRINNLKLNLSLKQDIALIPKAALAWRNDFANNDSDISEWFTSQMEPYLLEPIDEKKPVLMHDMIMWQYYRQYYINEVNPSDTFFNHLNLSKFKKELHQIYQQNNWTIEVAGSPNSKNAKSKIYRKQVSNLGALNFDYTRHGDYKVPVVLDKSDLDAPFGGKTTGWYTMKHHADVD